MGFPGVGAKRRTSLKSIEFSDGGFHFKLPHATGRVSVKLKVAAGEWKKRREGGSKGRTYWDPYRVCMAY